MQIYLLNVTDRQIFETGIIFIFMFALNCLLLFVKRIFPKIYGLWKWGEQPFILIHEELEMGTCWPLKRIKIGQALLTISYFLQTKGKNLTNIKIDDSKISEISRPWKDIHIFCLIVFVKKINWFPFYIILRNNLLLHCIIDNPDFYIYISASYKNLSSFL